MVFGAKMPGAVCVGRLCLLALSGEEGAVGKDGTGVFVVLHDVCTGHALALLAGDIEDDLAAVHHDGAVADVEGAFEIVGDHEGGDVVLVHDVVGQAHDGLGADWVEGGGVLVQEEHIGHDDGGHDEGEGLALAAGEGADFDVHAILKAHAKAGEVFAEEVAVFLRQREAQRPDAAGGVGESEVFLDGHVRRAAAQRILEEAADDARAFVRWQIGDVLPFEVDAPSIDEEIATDGVEEGGFPCAVGADDGDEIAFLDVQREAVEGFVDVAGACREGFFEFSQCEHLSGSPFSCAACREAA